jgi:selenium metabolism protein YedF
MKLIYEWGLWKNAIDRKTSGREDTVMTMEIDCRGLSCPQPVINTKKALEALAEGTVTVLVDNPESRENVRRFAASQGCEVVVSEKGGAYALTITKKPGCDFSLQAGAAEGPTVVCITTNVFGKGSDELGAILMKAFLNTLWDHQPRPAKLIFVNAGVFLATEGSNVLDSLELLDKEGVEILACGTCLAFFGVKEKLKVGKVSNMHEIVSSLMTAGRVINL